MNFHNSVPFLHGFTDFGCTPRTADEAFLIGVDGQASVSLVVVPHRYGITEKSIFLHFNRVRQD